MNTQLTSRSHPRTVHDRTSWRYIESQASGSPETTTAGPAPAANNNSSGPASAVAPGPHASTHPVTREAVRTHLLSALDRDRSSGGWFFSRKFFSNFFLTQKPNCAHTLTQCRRRDTPCGGASSRDAAATTAAAIATTTTAAARRPADAANERRGANVCAIGDAAAARTAPHTQRAASAQQR
jgi:hypothetical protein